MFDQLIVDILVRRIKEGGLNPKTGEPMKLEDIISEPYRVAVAEVISGGK